MKRYNCVQTFPDYWIDIITWNNAIIRIRFEYLKQYNWMQIICIK